MNIEKKQLNIGLAGFGSMGRTHAYAVQNLPFFYSTMNTELPFSARISAVCTTSKSKSEYVSNEFSIEKSFDNFEKMVNCDSIDIIDICTPNIYHYEMIKYALEKGKHIYCEKPLCDDYQKAKEIACLAEKSGKICSVVLNNRYLSAIQRAKQIINEGRLGNIISFDFRYLHDTCTHSDKPMGWKHNADICGKGGVLFDLGPHVIDLAVMLCGKIHSVNACSQIAYPTHSNWVTNASEAFYMIVKTDSNATGTITASKICKGVEDGLSFEIYGTKGSLKFSLMDAGTLYFFDGTSESKPYGGFSGFTAISCNGRYPEPSGIFPSPKAPQGWLRGHIESMYNFLNCVYLNKKCDTSFEYGAYINEVMDAALNSAENHCEVIL